MAARLKRLTARKTSVPVGAAVVVAVGLGLLPSLDERNGWCRRKNLHTHPAVKPIYDRNYAVFQELYKANKKNLQPSTANFKTKSAPGPAVRKLTGA